MAKDKWTFPFTEYQRGVIKRISINPFETGDDGAYKYQGEDREIRKSALRGLSELIRAVEAYESKENAEDVEAVIAEKKEERRQANQEWLRRKPEIGG